MLSQYDKRGKLKPLPIGEQVFEKIITMGRAYVDKSLHVYNMVTSGSTFVFLSRPRRFGKSLLCYTLKAFFQGRRDLFEGLAITDPANGCECDWEEYPVIMLSMNVCKSANPDTVLEAIDAILSPYERTYGIVPNEGANVGVRLYNLIAQARASTGKHVVVIIDEYDAPLLEVMHDEVKLNEMRSIMKGFYEVLKPSEENLRFVFMTGITKFAQLSIFSTFNNINNISLHPDYADICGITLAEVKGFLMPYVERLAEDNGIDTEEAIAKLKEMYDGYHFTSEPVDVYNPFSLVLALDRRQIKSYWFESGTPTFLIEMMKKFGTLPTDLESVYARDVDFDRSTDRLENVVPLLYQSGYLTIKSYDAELDEYTLELPNREVRQGLMYSLAPIYAGSAIVPMRDMMMEIRRAIHSDDMDKALSLIRDFLVTVPYTYVANHEGHYQQMLFIIFSLMGAYTDIEVRTSKGRIDVMMATRHRLYVIELKMGKSAAAAMSQIDRNKYFKRFENYALPISKVGISFSPDERTLTDWTIE